MKKILSLLMVVLMSTLFFIGCGDEEKNNNQNTSQNISQNTNEGQDSMLSQDEKDSYKEKAKKALVGLEVNDIDVLTQNKTKKPIISVQVVFNGTKGNIDKKSLENFIKDIKKRIEPVSKLYDITILDRNTQIIATTGYENEGKINFFE
ncbi:TPA: hypothetical protein NJT26_000224 [Clostridium perfringens]|uniref:gp23 n=1 Tax=Clostridium phage PhiS63 TaxID=1187894 RepID=UPI00025F77A6|nr:hypothetical protein [Clostridium perfringens]YP_006383527.1 gp23 [Clostridium phage PhiS63]AFJ96081.1 gp23 [Clostridium phage PhiS63]MDK0699265.1 hypothetical protein [Clostridium perfringens]MDU4220184.1 hypothetical protein [Clostridium perfringens]NGT47740.1 hypothetical protein [Clostridium perfringens]BDA34810.1 hypothetical protein CPBEC5_18180 [Clostridium perfringens]